MQPMTLGKRPGNLNYKKNKDNHKNEWSKCLLFNQYMWKRHLKYFNVSYDQILFSNLIKRIKRIPERVSGWKKHVSKQNKQKQQKIQTLHLVH
jgi:hypothetical protein